MLGGAQACWTLDAVWVCDEKTGYHEDPEDDLVGGPVVCVLLENHRWIRYSNEMAGCCYRNSVGMGGYLHSLQNQPAFDWTARAVDRFSSPENQDDLLFSSIDRKRHHHSLRTPLWLVNATLDLEDKVRALVHFVNDLFYGGVGAKNLKF